METVNMHQAKTHLSRLVAKAASGESIVIARAGKPMARLVPMEQPKPLQRYGMLEGQCVIPDDFDTMGREEIEQMLGLND